MVNLNKQEIELIKEIAENLVREMGYSAMADDIKSNRQSITKTFQLLYQWNKNNKPQQQKLSQFILKMNLAGFYG